MNKKVGIWLRVSTEDQAKGESPQHHEARARSYAQLNDWEVVTVYHLEGVSGESVKDHPEMRRMRQDITSGKITGLIFSKLARVARNAIELLEISDFFRKQNADLISLQEKIDTSSPAGRLFYTIIAAMAQWEREEISERVAASVPIRAKLGKSLGGAAPYGYAWRDKKLELDTKEAPIRKKIFEYFLLYKRRKHVARKLNQEGYRTRNGSLFSDSTVSRLISDPIAKGVRRANYTKSEGKGKHWSVKPEEDWVLTEAPAIVSEELWKKCNEILDATGVKYQRVAKLPTHLFGGLTVCHCGGKMYVKSNNHKYICTKCQSKVLASDLEEIFQERLRDLLHSKTEFDSYISKIQNAINKKKQIEKSLIPEIEEIKKKLEALIELNFKKELPAEGFKAHYMPLHTQLQQKETYFAQIQGELDMLTVQYKSTDTVFDEAKQLNSDWSNRSRDEKRAIIEDIVQEITISNDEIEFMLKGIPRDLSSDRWQNGNASLSLWVF